MPEPLPRGVVALGLVSLFMDVSSEMIHALLPLFLTTTLGAPVLVVGLIEGAGEATAQVVKVFSGLWSDRAGRRKPLLVAGYGLAALTKPAFALAGGAGLVMAARLADRFGKGIRGAPRDAMVADMVPPERRGAAFGLRQSLDTVGAVAGPLAAIAIMALSSGNIRLVFALAVLPALVAVAVLALGVREPARSATAPAVRPKFDRATLGALRAPYWRVCLLGTVLSAARLSEAFLILRVTGEGLPFVLAPLALALMSLVYAATSWPAGHLSDRIGSRGLLSLSLLVLAAAHLLLASGAGLAAAFAGIALWGLHMGLSQGLLSAAVARTVPADLRGTGFGLFNLAGGLATLVANGLAGAVWGLWGAGATYALGAVAALAALALARSDRAGV